MNSNPFAHVTVLGLTEPMPTSPAAVTAAMIAIGEESGNHVADTSLFWDGKQAGCVQGAMLAKLGYPFPQGTPVAGSSREVVRVLEIGSTRVFNALTIAQQSSDAHLPWRVAVEFFERAIKGESFAHLSLALNERLMADMRARRASADLEIAALSATIHNLHASISKSMAHMGKIVTQFNTQPTLKPIPKPAAPVWIDEMHISTVFDEVWGSPAAEKMLAHA